MLTDRQTNKIQTNERTELHQFREEPSYDLSTLNLIGQIVYELESGNSKIFDGQTGKKLKKKHTELHQFRTEPSCDGDLCPCQV